MEAPYPTPAAFWKQYTGDISAPAFLRIVLTILALSLCLIAPAAIWLLRGPEHPPIRLSGSISLDSKIFMLRDLLRQGARLDTAIAGSSVALNDVSSDLLAGDLGGQKVINLAAWGLKISESRRLLNHFLPLFQFDKVILVITAPDFGETEHMTGDISDEDLDLALRGPEGPAYYAMLGSKFSFLYLAKQWLWLRSHDERTPESLRFDSGGSVPLEVFADTVDPYRWDHSPDPGMIRQSEYVEFAGLAGDLKRRGIGLFVIQAPIRSAPLKPQIASGLARHWLKVAQIASQNQTVFIETQESLHLDDSFFADFLHLNLRGMAALTNYVAERINANSR